MKISYKQKELFYTLFAFLMLMGMLFTVVFYFLSQMEGQNKIGFQIFGGGDDGFFYWKQIQKIINGEIWQYTSIYPLFISSIILFTKINNVFLIRLVNFIGFFISVVFLLKISEQLLKDKMKNIYLFSSILTFLIFYFSFYINIFSSIYRDIWIICFYLISLYISIKLFFGNSKALLKYFILIILVLVVYLFRPYAALSFVISILYYFITRKFKVRYIIILYLLLFLLYTFFGNNKIPFINYSIYEIFDYRNHFITQKIGSSQMGYFFYKDNFILFIRNFLLSSLENLFGPFIYHFYDAKVVLLFLIESIPIQLGLIFIFYRRKYLIVEEKYILIHILIWSLLIGFSNDNIGASTRLRILSVLLLMIIICVEITKQNFYD